MATRFYGRDNAAAPVTVAVDAGWESSASPFAKTACFTSTDSGDTLATDSGFTSTAGQDRAHRQWVSPEMASGQTFDTSITYKAYAQCLESAANDNIRSRLGVRIVSSDGGTVRHTVLAIADYSTATEWNGSLRNKAFANGDAGTGSYTTVSGDRLVIEWGHNDSAGSSISGSSRWGSAGTADLGENETSTSTTERPWFETSLTITFNATAVNIAGTVAMASTITAAQTRVRNVTAAVDMTSTISASVIEVVAKLVTAAIDMSFSVSAAVTAIISKPVAGTIAMAFSLAAATVRQRAVAPTVGLAMSVAATVVEVVSKPVAAAVNLALAIAAAVAVEAGGPASIPRRIGRALRIKI